MKDVLVELKRQERYHEKLLKTENIKSEFFYTSAPESKLMTLSARWTYLLLFAVLAGVLILAAGCISDPPSWGVVSVSPTESLNFYTEQLPPYNYQENGTLKSFSVNLLEGITEKMGSKVSREQVHLVPWTEGYQAVLTRNNSVLFTAARLPEREQSFKWAGPVYAYTNVLFARPDRQIVITGPESLKGYRIGVIVDDVAVQQLLDVGVNKSQLVPETNVSSLVEKLSSGEIDLWAYPEASGSTSPGS